MKLHADTPQPLNTITAYGEGYLEVNRQQRYCHSLLIMPQGDVKPWPVNTYAQLAEHHFSSLVENTLVRPELIIFGSGQRHRFPPAQFLRALTALRIGVETMDTQAACRTYNILMAEGRQILAALLLETNESN